MATGMSLHIGLNTVDPKHYQGWDGQLAACENDATSMEALAEALGYSPRTVLLTKDATARKVTAAIKKAATKLVAGDTFFITYAGHGGQVPDTNGDEARKSRNEVGELGDAYDETWLLYDRELVDDELYQLWALFKPKVRIVMLSDSCHSGTVARPAPWDTENVDPWPNRRIPLELQDRVYEANKRTYDSIQRKTKSRDEKAVKAGVILISGCMDNQTSGDGPRNGRFTGQLLEVWKDGGFKGTLPDLHKAIVVAMPPYQTPNLYYVGGRVQDPLGSGGVRLLTGPWVSHDEQDERSADEVDAGLRVEQGDERDVIDQHAGQDRADRRADRLARHEDAGDAAERARWAGGLDDGEQADLQRRTGQTRQREEDHEHADR